MSFAATAGLIATYEVWSRRREWRSGTWARVSFAMKSLAVTSFVGAAATAPYALYHFDRVAGMGLLANLLAMPIVTFVSAPAAALSLLLAPFGLSELGLALFGLSLEWILAIAHWCDGLASSDFTFPVPMPAAALVGFSLALAGGVIGKGGWRLVFAGLGTAFAVNSWAGSAAPTVHWAPNGDVYIVDGQAGAQRIAFVDGDGLGPLRYSDLAVARDCRARDCEIRIGERTVALLQDAPRCRSSGSAQKTLTLVAEASVSALSDQNSPPCTPRITWTDARASNGTTATFSRDGTIKIVSPPCGHRPWAICPVPEDEN